MKKKLISIWMNDFKFVSFFGSVTVEGIIYVDEVKRGIIRL